MVRAINFVLEDTVEHRVRQVLEAKLEVIAQAVSYTHLILLGWASELPVLVQMNALPEGQRPKSDDPDFWAV